MKRLSLALAAGLLGLSGSVGAAFADPVDDKLVIDGKEMITRTKAPEGHPFDEVYSGWLFREAETRATEADSFANPGMLTVERGEEIWNTIDGTAGKSCASCHGDASVSMKDIGANYPKWDATAKKPINVELQIDKCRTEKMGAEAYKFDAEEQKSLTTYIKHQSLGTPVAIDLGAGEMQSWWEKGKTLYYTRTGQLNLSCANCHENSMGKFIRADHLSQGQVNGFPTYRFNTGGMVSLHNRFRGCIRDTRAEMPKAFSDELMALEVYVTWRGLGLSVETPAVRQ
ncbi:MULTISPECIES: sulfur oxidation c-type cytochrome SoxA [Alphaproteobacteria]|uniref:SoxAX cytochrome complex subunit A n=2 Tax=Alphaproteobacteria TaxID=28211 RepID=A0A512HIK4_9HYPH|nr:MULTISPECIES: sulfur oxidation c-type cytochrome SoxA [Alphaproteobacteria]GEO85273.1 SoxAX cytochrome complex subunit A [Ciceribacter naphthalenivorans]GLR20912.1 SoxAX cytochrome complex subunit A [Ciceribacter naphthalenivorans]GLT03768.1 SoxAX cytochrome complex subunit A [Sphingomonas psychrolutea]